MDRPKTPMVDRAIQLEPVNLEIVRFLKWLAHEKGLVLCRSTFDPHATDPTAWRPIPMRDHEGLVADFQGIDLAQVAAERRELVKWANSRVTGDGLGEGPRD